MIFKIISYDKTTFFYRLKLNGMKYSSINPRNTHNEKALCELAQRALKLFAK